VSGFSPVPAPDHLVVGLGNPGSRYERTRHNVGFRVADLLGWRLDAGFWLEVGPNLVCEGTADDHRVLLAKPQAYMNRSGPAVVCLLRETGLDLGQTIVAYDDLDLPFGRIRIREGGGHGGHRGVLSLMEAARSGCFIRIRIGIGRPQDKGDVVEYVLSDFSPEEEAGLGVVLDRASDAAECIVTHGVARAMNRFST
jgi:PTH1 family peptidyl-tRNA hydrolase